MDTKYNLQEKGGVYVINNKAIVNPETKQPLTKIGRSGKENPEERIMSMNKETPVPQDFEIEGIVKTPANKILENITHKYLEDEHYKKECYTTDTRTSLNIVIAIDENIKKHSYCFPDKNFPVSEEEKKQFEKSGYVSSDYYVTPYSDAEYYLNEDDCPKGLDRNKWKKTVKSINSNDKNT